MNVEQAKLIPLAEILHTINCQPVKVRADDIWYKSPFREENTAGFHIKPSGNVWYDHGIGKGGNSLDFAMHHLASSGEDHNVADALRWLSNMVKLPGKYSTPVKSNVVAAPGWILKRVEPLEDLALIRYAEKRGIPYEVAHAHFSKVYVQNSHSGERMYALGFKNEDGGYELRNIYIKSCVAPKTITFKRGEVAKPKAIHLFEGSFDYLSALERFPQYIKPYDSIILNSISCLEKAWPYLIGYGYATLYSWMDNDLPGNNATKKITEFVKSQDGLTHKPMNGLYREFKDVNDWHVTSLKM
jgi:hypothetical protein